MIRMWAMGILELSLIFFYPVEPGEHLASFSSNSRMIKLVISEVGHAAYNFFTAEKRIIVPYAEVQYD